MLDCASPLASPIRLPRLRTSAAPRMAVLLGVALSFWTARSEASFHEMKIREFFPGTAGQPNAQYVMLQMYAAGQTKVKTHTLRIFDASEMQVGSFTFAANVATGATQSTILIATPEAVTLFGVAADLGMTAVIPLGGGKVCWELIDCVAWGSYAGSSSGTGTPYRTVDGLTLGQAVRRDISAGNPALLENADDTNNSAADFDCADATPKNNAGASGFLAASPPCPVCGDDLAEQGEECDGTDDGTCPGLCEGDCTCAVPDQTLLGKVLVVQDPLPNVDATRRKFSLFAKELVSPNTLEGNPIADGATVEVSLSGTTPSSQLFVLPPGSFWTPISTIGFKYRDPFGTNGPVTVLLLKKTPSGVFLLRVKGKGLNGTIDLVPPDPGSSASATVMIGANGYCTAFGAAAGGLVNPNDARIFKVTNPTAEVPCM